MAFFELTTNAVKYEALSNNAGRVEIRWLRSETHGTQDLELNWIERDGPPVAAPQRRGFGTQILEQVLPHDIKASVVVEYPATGVTVSIKIKNAIAE